MPNTEWLDETVERNRIGEIIVDKSGATSVPGLFAAGDCTDGPYNQIIISMGSGATAALGAFDYLIRINKSATLLTRQDSAFILKRRTAWQYTV